MIPFGRLKKHTKDWVIRGIRASSGIRVSIGLVARAFCNRAGAYPDHLALHPDDEALGPVQREEAMLLFALVRLVRPKLVVELGFHRGLSALNFLIALPPDGRLVSFDISADAEALARARYGGDRRFRFVRASQEVAAQALVGQGPVDLLFFDASHDLELNCRTFEELLPLLAPAALVAVHDTGSWLVAGMTGRHRDFAGHHPKGGGAWLSEEEYLPWPSERRFVNWIREQHPQFGMLHLHSHRTLRHGLTLLQRSGPLAVP